jgi:hypothetical protein
VLRKDFNVVTLNGICIPVPPEFFKNFTKRFPRLFKVLSKIDKVICKYLKIPRLFRVKKQKTPEVITTGAPAKS